MPWRRESEAARAYRSVAEKDRIRSRAAVYRHRDRGRVPDAAVGDGRDVKFNNLYQAGRKGRVFLYSSINCPGTPKMPSNRRHVWRREITRFMFKIFTSAFFRFLFILAKHANPTIFYHLAVVFEVPIKATYYKFFTLFQHRHLLKKDNRYPIVIVFNNFNKLSRIFFPTFFRKGARADVALKVRQFDTVLSALPVNPGK